MAPSNFDPQDLFPEAAQTWSLNELYQDLARIKGRHLTPTEKAYLRALLCSLSPREIATQCHVEPDTVRTTLSRSLYRHIEGLLIDQAIQEIQVKSWTKIPQLLEGAGYRHKSNSPAFNAPSPDTSNRKSDCSSKPNVDVFYGRKAELEQLQQWALNPAACRCIFLWGAGGMGKTTLASQLTDTIQDQFDVVIWRSLRNVSSLQSFLTDLIERLKGPPIQNDPGSITEQISQLMECLHQQRCFLVLDHVQTVFQSGELAGRYQPQFEGYGELFRRIQTEAHQSCILLTSWEKLREAPLPGGEASPVKSLKLEGLGEAAKQILEDEGLASPERWDELIIPYRGNPFALRMIAEIIQDLFSNSVSDFLDQNTLFLGDFDHLLHQKFQRLSPLEQSILTQLSQQEQPQRLSDLMASQPESMRRSELMSAVHSLQCRALLETIQLDGGNAFTLQPTMAKYIATRGSNASGSTSAG